VVSRLASRLQLSFLILMLSVGAGQSFGQTLLVTLSDQNSNPVEGAVVEILLPEDLKQRFQSQQNIAVDQLDKEFVPSVSTVVVGNEVSFPNSDAILHHVYSFSPINTFNIPLYGKAGQLEYSQEFAISGVVEIGCNIHDWMLAYIYVAETNLSGISNSEGVASVSGFPDGYFQLRVWHPRLSETNNSLVVDVEFSADSSASLEFSLELERDRRIRRAPSSAKKRYR
jgi:plastocyanin